MDRVLSVLNSLVKPPPEMESLAFFASVLGTLFYLFVLVEFSREGRPVAHPDRMLWSKHKAAEAKRIEIFEKLTGRSTSGDHEAELQSDGDRDSVRPPVDGEENGPTVRTPLLGYSMSEAVFEATVTLYNGISGRFPFNAFVAMKAVNGMDEELTYRSDKTHVFYNSEQTLLQTNVELHGRIVDQLKDMLVQLTSDPSKNISAALRSVMRTPTLQLDNWAVLRPSDDSASVELLRLPVDKVPVILHAEYAAGLLTITGLNLKNASVIVTAHSNNISSLNLEAFRFHENTGVIQNKWCCRRVPRIGTYEDIGSFPIRLSWYAMKGPGVLVYAVKVVQIGDIPVVAVSKVVRITDALWKTVLRLWIPCLASWAILIYNVTETVRWMPLAFPGLVSFFSSVLVGGNGIFFYPWMALLVGGHSSRVFQFLAYNVETLIRGVGQALLLVYCGFTDMLVPRLKVVADRGADSLPAGRKPFPPPPPPKPSGATRPNPPRPEPNSSTASAAAAAVKSVDDPAWEWPAFNHFEGTDRKVQLTKCLDGVRDDVTIPFQVLYCRRKHQLWPDVVRVELISPALIEIVRKFLSGNGNLQSLAQPKVKGRDLFTVLDDLKNYSDHELPTTSGGDPTSNDSANSAEVTVDGDESGPPLKHHELQKGRLHLRHLVRFMDEEFNEVSVRRLRMADEKRVAWDMLWTFLTPGKKVVYTCDHTQEMLAAVVSKNSYSYDMEDCAFVVHLDVWDYDGRSYHKCQILKLVPKFDGEVEFSTLCVRPVEIEGILERLEQGFLANGRRFHELAVKNSHRFMHYSGPMFQLKNTESSKRLVKQNADGRVMIDLVSFAKINPGYRMGNARPPVGAFWVSIDRFNRSKRFDDREAVLDLAPPRSGAVADDCLIYAPAIVYGYSFTLMQWGSFAVGGFTQIDFDSNAFDALEMEPDRKQLVYKLVSQYIPTPAGPSQPRQRVDPIAHKGEGCIFLCYGPPGTGKRLTAESVAESLHRPLLSLRASELGGTAREVKKSLLQVLDVAVVWRPVVVLEDADVFVKKRTSPASVLHNSIVGIFLEFLESYRGVLFITTNRIAKFDNAFHSKISMFLRYPKLSAQQRERVWTALLARAGVAGITPEFVSEIAAEDLNGRDIRNSIHMAEVLAKSNGEALDKSHVRHVTSVLVSTLAGNGDRN